MPELYVHSGDERWRNGLAVNRIRIGDTLTVACPMGVTREVTVVETTERSILVGYPLPRGKGTRRFWVERDRLPEPELTADEKLRIAAVYVAVAKQTSR